MSRARSSLSSQSARLYQVITGTCSTGWMREGGREGGRKEGSQCLVTFSHHTKILKTECLLSLEYSELLIFRML